MSEFQPDTFINNRYKVLRLLGRGAMGEVYLCEDAIKIHRLVALKVLKSDKLESEADFWSKGEYEALTRLRHPNLAKVYDFARVQDSEDYYIVSEFIRGEDLLSATQEMELDEFFDIVAQICRALEYIHSQGYVHFDIKPDNILVTREKAVGADEGSKVEWSPSHPGSTDRSGTGPARIKLIDFGLAEQITGTFNFAIKGTFYYVAPEIIQGRTPDKRADLYSLGVTLFQILTGKLPLVGDDGKAIDRSRINWREEIRQELEDRPSWIVEILVRLLEDDPDQRFPSARAIIQSLSSGSGRHYEVETAETQVSYLYSSRLVGRRKELNRLKEEAETIFARPDKPNKERTGDTSVVTRLLRGGDPRPSIYIVSGEIGVGKSRLFEEFMHFLRMREIPVHTGNCYETSQDAYHPFREIIEQLALAVGLESEPFQAHKAALIRLCPKLKSSQDLGDTERGFRPDKERLYFIDHLASFLIDAAAAMPCVINLNNLHWADEASSELLAYLVEKLVEFEVNLQAQLPLMITATLRSDETFSDSLRNCLATLRQEERTEEIILRRLSRAQIAELIHSMLQVDEIPTQFLDRLEERTSGNPLFIVETLKGLQEDGIIAREGDQWKIRTGGQLSRVELPHGIDAILLRRFQGLDSNQRKVLEALAVYDKPMSVKLLEKLPEFENSSVITSLRELENRGMVSKTLDSGKLQFSVSQPKLREIIYDNLEPTRKSRLHRFLGDILLEDNGDKEEIIEDIASHYQHSDHDEKALEYTIRAAENCRRVFAHERAVEHYRRVVKQTENQPKHFRVWFETHERIGDIGTLSGNYELAQGSYDYLLEASLDESFSFIDRARILRKRGKVDEIRGEYDIALRLYKEARDLFEESEDETREYQAELVRIYNAIGWVYVCMGKYDRAMKIAVDALRKIEGLDEKGEHAMIFSTIGSANYFKGNLDQAIEFHSRALEIRENLENVPDIIISLNNLGDAYLASCEYMEALKHYKQALSAAEEIGDAFGRAMALHNLSKTHLSLGADNTAEDFLDKSLKLSRDFKMRYLTTSNFLLRGRLRRRGEEFAKAESDLFRALGVFAKQGTRWGLLHCLLEVAELQSQRGNLDEAIRLAQEAVATAVSLNVVILEARARLLEISVLRSLNTESAESLIDRLNIISRTPDVGKNVELLGQIEIERAEILVKKRELDEARDAFRRADERFREVAERLPAEYRDPYLSTHHVAIPGLGPRSPFREVGGRDSDETVAVPAASLGVKPTPSSAPPPPRKPEPSLSSQDQELLRVASLLQEFSQTSSPRTFAEKALSCLIKAVSAEEGFLLTCEGDRVRIFCALDSRLERVKKAGRRICLEALEFVWSNSTNIFAPRVLDDEMVQGYEVFYRENISSICIISLSESPRAALYLNNPNPEHVNPPIGSPVLASYQNLLRLTVPRPSVVS